MDVCSLKFTLEFVSDLEKDHRVYGRSLPHLIMKIIDKPVEDTNTVDLSSEATPIVEEQTDTPKDLSEEPLFLFLFVTLPQENKSHDKIYSRKCVIKVDSPYYV